MGTGVPWVIVPSAAAQEIIQVNPWKLLLWPWLGRPSGLPLTREAAKGGGPATITNADPQPH